MNDQTQLDHPAIDRRAQDPAGDIDSDDRSSRHTEDMHDLLHALQAMRIGDFSVRLPSDRTGLEG